MGELVNLRMARKSRDRKAREETAQANRISHGLSKAEKTLAEKTRDLAAGRLDGHRLDKDD